MTERKVNHSLSSNVNEEEIQRQMDDEVEQAVRELGPLNSNRHTENAIGSRETWDRATSIVKQVRPVPWPIWVITRSVFGLNGKLGSPDPLIFARFEYMLMKSLTDGDIVSGQREVITKEKDKTPLYYLSAFLGVDVAAALCFVHAASRRVLSLLPPRIGAAIIEEALLRAQIGLIIGRETKEFKAGRGILAGFAARIGLAIQFASGSPQTAEKALEELASGTNFHKVGLSLYGCDPLQVSAMALVAGGCGQSAAYGVAAFNVNVSQRGTLTHDAFKWLSAFSIAEHLRLGNGELIYEESWLALGIPNKTREKIYEFSRTLVRYGHSWQWILEPPDNT